MKTFTGLYSKINHKFVFASTSDYIRSCLISILNTHKGSRFYYPDYGTEIYKYKFAPLNFFTINNINIEIRSAIECIEGLHLDSSSVRFKDDVLYFDLVIKSDYDTFNISVGFAKGVME